MDFDKIINCIDEFYRTADEKTLAKVNEAFSIAIEGDISLDEYISGFSDQYFYTDECESKCYVSGGMLIQSNARQYKETDFEGTSSDYGKTDLSITLNLETSDYGEVEKMIKRAA